jgi:stage IV sporulation protein FA
VEVKANVQKRRQERIRELQARASGRRPELLPVIVPDTSKVPQSAGDLPLFIKGPMEYDHGGDPEVAWREREKELLRQYSQSGEKTYATSYAGQGSRSGYGSFGGDGPFRKLLMVKTVIAVILFGGTLALFQFNHPLAQKGREYVTGILTEDMDFGQMAAWYDKTFSGSPSFLPAFGIKQEATKVQAPISVNRFIQPVKGTAAAMFTESKQGVWVETKRDAHVAAMDEGRIEFAGDRTDIGHTVIIQHADGLRTTYGGLQPTKWEAGDWVKAGDVIGTAGGDSAGKGRVFIAVMKDQRYVNPLEVVAFD